MTYTVVDGDANTDDSDAATQTFTITVRDADTAPSFSATVADQIYIEGDVVEVILPEASGGNGALSYSLVPEVPGLTFDTATRTVSGSPIVADTYSMTYTVVDGDDNTEDSDDATQTFTITVEPDTAPSFAEPVEDQSYTAGDDVSVTLPEASSGNGALSYALEPKVPGLTFDMATRTLSGTPTTPATYGMTYTVTMATTTSKTATPTL